ncbi:MAG TPA: IS630 transposase-related protein [Candidatus Wujingus californicus]|uniref:IS630 transposase-related protein n=1 Tax=Candidatus Wujingus californicus TaxID=3367618 RepID=UPI0040285659
MTKAYDTDFRELALKHLERGELIEDVCATFGICLSVLYKWKKQKKETGDVSPQKRINKPRKANYEQIRELIKNNPDWTQAQIAKAVGMSPGGMCCVFKRLGIYLKKRVYITKKVI